MFRFDASPAIGGGHAIRCGALAAELARQGHRCGFVTNDAGAKLAAGTLTDADVLVVADDDDEFGAMRKRWPDGADWVVVDHYDCDASFEQSARRFGRKVMAVDDRPTRAHASDILLDQTLDRSETEYRALVNADCKVLTGAGYTLLRDEFRSHRAAALARRDALPRSPSIVISFGASDPGKASLRALEALQLVANSVHIEILIGSLCPHVDEIRVAVQKDRRASLVIDPASVARHFADADIAIGAPGMTAWERACLGLPAIIIPVADNQIDNAAALQRHGAVSVLPMVGHVTADEIASAISSLLDQPERWRAMSAAAAKLVDGNGVKRVSAAMIGA